jgi:hypothetical protein
MKIPMLALFVCLPLLVMGFPRQLIAQLASPVGTWVLKAHVVTPWLAELNEPAESDTDVHRPDYQVQLQFDAAGSFIQKLPSEERHGHWKLKSGHRKLVLKFNDGSKYRYLDTEPIDFMSTLQVAEALPALYQGLSVAFGMGESHYERLGAQTDTLDLLQYLGKWEVNERQLGKKKQPFSPPWWYEISIDSSSDQQQVKKRWETDVPQLKNSDAAILKQRWHPYVAKYYLLKGADGQLMQTGYFGKKVEVLYLEQITH